MRLQFKLDTSPRLNKTRVNVLERNEILTKTIVFDEHSTIVLKFPEPLPVIGEKLPAFLKDAKDGVIRTMTLGKNLRMELKGNDRVEFEFSDIKMAGTNLDGEEDNWAWPQNQSGGKQSDKSTEMSVTVDDQSTNSSSSDFEPQHRIQVDGPMDEKAASNDDDSDFSIPSDLESLPSIPQFSEDVTKFLNDTKEIVAPIQYSLDKWGGEGFFYYLANYLKEFHPTLGKSHMNEQSSMVIKQLKAIVEQVERKQGKSESTRDYEAWKDRFIRMVNLEVFHHSTWDQLNVLVEQHMYADPGSKYAVGENCIVHPDSEDESTTKRHGKFQSQEKHGGKITILLDNGETITAAFNKVDRAPKRGKGSKFGPGDDCCVHTKNKSKPIIFGKFQKEHGGKIEIKLDNGETITPDFKDVDRFNAKTTIMATIKEFKITHDEKYTHTKYMQKCRYEFYPCPGCNAEGKLTDADEPKGCATCKTDMPHLEEINGSLFKEVMRKQRRLASTPFQKLVQALA